MPPQSEKWRGHTDTEIAQFRMWGIFKQDTAYFIVILRSMTLYALLRVYTTIYVREVASGKSLSQL